MFLACNLYIKGGIPAFLKSIIQKSWDSWTRKHVSACKDAVTITANGWLELTNHGRFQTREWVAMNAFTSGDNRDINLLYYFSDQFNLGTGRSLFI